MSQRRELITLTSVRLMAVASLCLAAPSRAQTNPPTPIAPEIAAPSPDELSSAAGSIEASAQSIKSIDANDLRRNQKTRPLAPFRPLQNHGSLENPGKAIDDTIAHGWRVLDSHRISMEPPIDWSALHDVNRSVNFSLHSWVPLVPFASQATTAGRYAELAFSLGVVEDWIASHPLPAKPTRHGDGAFAWYDMVVGLRINVLATLLDAACRDDIVSNETITRLWGSLVDHFIYLEDDRRIAFHSNHGIFQAAGQLAAARRFDWHPMLQSAAEQANRRLQRLLNAHFTAEGVHKEHSPEYHIAVMRIYSALRNADLLPSIADFDQRFAAMQDAAAWMILPDGLLLNFGDTDRTELTSAQLDKNGWKSEALRYAATQGHEGSPPDSRVRGFPDSGFVALRSGWPTSASDASYLAMQCAFHSRAHKHADDLTITWFDRGRLILTDAGRYGYLGTTAKGSTDRQDGFYYSDPNRIYVESTRAHNTIQIDDRNHERRAVPPYHSALRHWGESDGVQYAVASVTHDKSVLHRRIIATKPHTWLIVIDDVRDKSDASHDVKQWFQMGPDVAFDGRRDDSFEFNVGEKADRLWAVPIESRMRLTDPVRGVRSPELQGWWSPRTLVMAPIWSWHSNARGSDVRLATLFAFSRNAPVIAPRSAAMSRDSIAYSWTMDGVKETLTIDMRPTRPHVACTSTPDAPTSQPAE